MKRLALFLILASILLADPVLHPTWGVSSMFESQDGIEFPIGVFVGQTPDNPRPHRFARVECFEADGVWTIRMDVEPGTKVLVTDKAGVEVKLIDE